MGYQSFTVNLVITFRFLFQYTTTQKVLISHCLVPPPPHFPFFSVADANHQLPKVTYVRNLGVPGVIAFTSSVQWEEAANTPFNTASVRRSSCAI